MIEKIESLQSLRAVAFLMIFMSHCIPLKISGQLGVSIFFSLSGFVLCYSFRSRETDGSFRTCMQFMWRRIRKLYPLHLVTLLLSVPFVISQADTAQFWTGALLNAGLLQSWVPKSAFYFSFNAVSWYLSASAFTYAVFPWLIGKIPEKEKNGYYIGRIGLAALMILLVGLLGSCVNERCLWFSDGIAQWVTYIFPVTRVLNVTIGILLCLLFLQNRDRWGQIPAVWANCLMAAAIGICAGTLLLRNSTLAFFSLDGISTNALVIPGTLALFAVFLINRDFLTRFLTKECFLKLAELTPQLFLIHRLVILYVNEVIETYSLQPSQWLRIPLCFTLSVFFALIWKKVEAAMKTPRKVLKGKENQK